MPRLPRESTASFLARTLETVGLKEMAERARLGHFDDYFCPPEIDDGMGISRLVTELIAKAKVQPLTEQRDQIAAVVDMAMHGDFDGTRAESEEWARGNSEGAKVLKVMRNVFDPKED